ncbi:hypothetical protein HanRHA438_Chr01g0003391 [Helianthus annuus]|nr:hypothetical protein HanRHA438_Chr01g0003391 [Helianthus annuus]
MGNNRPRTVAGNQQVSSASCSRSNSFSDKYRKRPSSPVRVGAHLGRSSLVRQPKRVVQSQSIHDGLVRSTTEKVPSGQKLGADGNGMV